MTTRQWGIFVAVQAIGILVLFSSNIHTSGFIFLLGYFLLTPGILVVSDIQALNGDAQRTIVAVAINALAWYFAFKVFVRNARTKI